MQFDLSKRPLGHCLSRQLFFEEKDALGKGWDKGLYLALSVESTSMFASTVSRPSGFIRLIPTADGAEQSYTLGCENMLAVARCGDAGSLSVAADGEKAMHLSATGLGLTVKVRLGSGESMIQTERGFEVIMGADRYVIQPLVGTGRMEVMWNLNALRSSDPVLYFEPVDGKLELLFWDTDVRYILPAAAESAEASAAKTMAEFSEFCSKLPEGADAALAYDLWIGIQRRRGQALVAESRITSQQSSAISQSVAVLALKDTSEKLKLLSGLFRLETAAGLIPSCIKESSILPEAAAPIFGVALRTADYASVDTALLESFYDGFTKAADWWFNQRYCEKGCFYAYAHECGFPMQLAVPAPRPCVSPDLLTYLIIDCEEIIRMAAVLGKNASLWKLRADALLSSLLCLIDGETVRSRDALSGEFFKTPAALECVPLLLAEKLPAATADALFKKAAALDACNSDYFLLGLLGLSCAPLAEKVKSLGAELSSVASAANYSPARSSMLLALNERSLTE